MQRSFYKSAALSIAMAFIALSLVACSVSGSLVVAIGDPFGEQGATSHF